MHKFLFLVGPLTCAEEDLLAVYRGHESCPGVEGFEFELPEDFPGDLQETAIYIGRGWAFTEGWSIDNSVFTLISLGLSK